MKIITRAEKISDDIISWRRRLHRIPEVGLHLPQTAEVVCEFLSELKIPYQTFENHSGIVAVIGEIKGKTIALRADMDGLPVKEELETDYKSSNENMHSCGHDAHTAILMGAARLLNEEKEKLNGQVKLIFQPGEEELTGARLMVRDGVLENPGVDRILALHVGSLGGKQKTGDIIVGRQALFASSESFRIEITGKGGHASTPHITIDPIVIAARIIEGLQTLVSREVKPGIPAVISVTSVQAGRETFNIIPDKAVLMGGIRTNNPETRDYLLKRAKEVVETIAGAGRGIGTFEIMAGCPPLVNDYEAVDAFVTSALKVLLPEEIHEMKEMNMGAEDASYLFQEVPGCYFFLCNHGAAEDGIRYPHHNGKFCIDDSVIYKGAALLTQAAMDFLEEKV